MRFTTPAIVCALRSHGEHGAIVRLMTPEHGLQAAYVRGARGRRMRPVLIAGNVVEASLSARTDAQLPQAAVELVHSRGPLLAELGFGLDLDRCAVSGRNDDLVAVSPKSGRAVSAAEAEPYAGKLLSLPPFVRIGGRASWEEIAQGLDLTGHFLARDLLTDRSKPIGEARARLVERLRRAGGLA